MSFRRSNGIIVGGIIIAAFCIITVISCSSSGEKGSAMSQLVPEEILGWTAQAPTEEYDREAIFDYINGAGEVYLSYGFQNVIVKRFSKTDAPEISVEVFDMKTAEDAYGVFSHSREREETGIGSGYEYRGSLLCFWKGPYFVCVRADKQTEESKEAVFALAREIDANIVESGDKPEIVNYLPAPNLSKGSVRFFHSQGSLNYHYFLAEENLLHLGENTRAAMGEYTPGPVHLLCIEYPSAGEAKQAYDSFIEGYLPEGKEKGAARLENGKWVVAEITGKYVVIVFDVKHEMAGRTLLKSCRELIESPVT